VTTKRLSVEIHGAVQGVGFRPFVYRLATELALNGWVINDTRGVFIQVEGAEAMLAQFLERLADEKPARAIIHSIDFAWLAPVGFERFEIRHSNDAGTITALVLPDIATCPDCLREIFDPTNRRYRYPFTNCTNCGPRFSIIESLPYDRCNTTMRHFTMCADCQHEYADPLDRRFHAQPNACPNCGPQLALWSARGEILAERDQALHRAAHFLHDGKIIALKGLGGFLLLADARNHATIARLRERKPRREKPFALMARDLAQARTLVEFDSCAETLLTSPSAPIVLLHRKLDAPVADNVAPTNPYLGVMLPYTPLHHLLLHAIDFPVIATSGNLSDEPICIDERDALQRLAGIADLFLVHNRPIARNVDDSVMTMAQNSPRFIRRARGFAPLPILLQQELPPILGVGAHLKNTIALSVGKQVFVSQHIGDLETPEAMRAFENVIADFCKMYDATPIAIAHDLHPAYLSTCWANSASFTQQGTRIAVQHHHAHLAACLVENNADRALGVIWDGTGYGIDGTIWGGEFLLGTAKEFQRVAHLRPFRLPGGEQAIHEPRRTAFALLYEMFGESMIERQDLALVRAFTPTEFKTLAQMLAKNINAPVTTSIGRLFDGVAALVDLYPRVSFEGQAAMALEFLADEFVTERYELLVKDEKKPSSFTLDWQPLIESILTDLARNVERSIIAAKFHNALVHAIVQIAQCIGEKNVALSGGCFQNRLLTERATEQLTQAGFNVLLHKQVPPNDGCISLGQVVVAARNL
jgi:hydrogenase maturation protein HypF